MYSNEYVDRLKEAINSDEFSNIAITGDYGVGKTSVIKDFERRIKAKFMYFSAINIEKNKTDDVKLYQNSIEKSLIQQLLLVCDDRTAEMSRFKSIPSGSKIKKQRWMALGVVITIFQIICLILKYPWLIKLKEQIINVPFLIKPIRYILNLDIINKVIAFFDKYIYLGISQKLKNYENLQLVFAIVSSIICVFILIRIIVMKYSLPKVTIQYEKNDAQFQIEAEANNEPTDLDSNINEIIYLFESIGKKCNNTFVFEDLDRYTPDVCIPIVVKLKRINLLLNSRLRFKFNRNKMYKFIYVLKDSVFQDTSKNRISENDPYKFFDVIIPVIPYINSQNSKYYMFQEWDRFNIDKKLLYDISPYFYDYRKIVDISNEYTIFLENIDIEKTIEHRTKLLAYVIYKVLFPSEYYCLRKDPSYEIDLGIKQSDTLEFIINGSKRSNCLKRILEYYISDNGYSKAIKLRTITNRGFTFDIIDINEMIDSNRNDADKLKECVVKLSKTQNLFVNNKFLEQIYFETYLKAVHYYCLVSDDVQDFFDENKERIKNAGSVSSERELTIYLLSGNINDYFNNILSVYLVNISLAFSRMYYASKTVQLLFEKLFWEDKYSMENKKSNRKLLIGDCLFRIVKFTIVKKETTGRIYTIESIEDFERDKITEFLDNLHSKEKKHIAQPVIIDNNPMQKIQIQICWKELETVIPHLYKIENS